MAENKITILDIRRMKEAGEKITMITAYDYPFARIFSDAGVEIILVGDSAAGVCAGHESTIPITMDEMIYHIRSVTRAKPRSLVVGDMPFMSYQVSVKDAIFNACRFIKEGYAEAVKLEGGVNVEDRISAITAMDIPVMGHIGLTPQSLHRMGGYRVQGRDNVGRKKLIEDARAVERAGAFSIVLEGIPSDLAGEISGIISIPTIGIGAGIECDGQVLVMHDILGLAFSKRPKFVKEYANLKQAATDAVSRYINEVKEKKFPTVEHQYS